MDYKTEIEKEEKKVEELLSPVKWEFDIQTFLIFHQFSSFRYA